jgi:ABC-type lipoprotein release transport system permease subunit
MARRHPIGLVLVLGARSLWAHKVKSLVVGSLLGFGTFVMVIGTSLVATVERTMSETITSSMAGHIQVYAKDAEDALALYGGMGMGAPDYGDIAGVEVLEPLARVDNVATIVPMGLTMATAFGDSQLDLVLAHLRSAIESGDEATVALLVLQARRMARSLRENREDSRDLTADQQKLFEEIHFLEEVDTDAFWQPTDRALVDELDARMAPLAEDGKMLFLQLVGVDLGGFATTFDRFTIVDGEPIPPGRRGILLNKRVYETQAKNLVARDLDRVWESVQEGKRIAEDPTLQEDIRRNSRQYARVTLGLSAADAERLLTEFERVVPDADGDLDRAMETFLLVDDTTIADRYRFFYDVVAPMIRLYDFPVGSVMPLRAYTKSGYVRSINVRIYGTYEFRGLEKSDLAGASNLVDLITFRELFGKMTDAQRAELEQIKASTGVQDVSREDAEAALFGGDGGLESTAPSDPSVRPEAEIRIEARRAPEDRLYTPEEMRDGPVVNAALVLKDPKRLPETLEAVRATIEREQLPLQAVDWRTAAGIVGQYLWVVRGVLAVMLTLIFLVAILVINNSMVSATMERTAEIGTLRAIGARRSIVVSMFMGETTVLGFVSGILGAVAAAVVLAVLHRHGIPATHEVLVFLFGGPRLYPSSNALDLLGGMALVIGVGVISTAYPAMMAAWVPPIVAMQPKE